MICPRSALAALAALGCAAGPAAAPGGHGAEPLALTRWADGHELFIELDPPVAGQAFGYHAHVTRSADHAAVAAGAFTLSFEQDGFAVEAHADPAPARPGIFAGEAAAPRGPGRYRLRMRYAADGAVADWDGGEVEVGDGAPAPAAAAPDGEIVLLKEAQWQIPFRVEPAEARALAPTVPASGVVGPDPAGTAVVAAPFDGLLLWDAPGPVVGRRVAAGERLGTLLPAAAAEAGAALAAEVAVARADRELARAELARLEGLPAFALPSAAQLEGARAALARAEARAAAAGARGAALQRGAAGAVAVRAPAEGLVVAAGAAHGEAAHAGDPLVHVWAGGGAVIRARVHARVPGGLPADGPLLLRRADGPPLDLRALGAERLTGELVYDPRAVSAPVDLRVPAAAGLRPGELVELELGVGAPAETLAVPRGAVVEVNGQDVVFVQIGGESFSRRRVRLGPADATHVAITEGLAPGDRVVVEGGFDLHVASVSGALESHRH
jgi:RND family efflux transporter MFP subunit